MLPLMLHGPDCSDAAADDATDGIGDTIDELSGYSRCAARHTHGGWNFPCQMPIFSALAVDCSFANVPFE
jgi:hypothetical protein